MNISGLIGNIYYSLDDMAKPKIGESYYVRIKHVPFIWEIKGSLSRELRKISKI